MAERRHCGSRQYFEEGNLIREAIEQGVVSSDFVKWSKSLATMAERRDGQDVGELINGATGENILPMGKLFLLREGEEQ